MFGFQKADISEIPIIRQIAYETWPVTYEPILCKEQVNYMLKKLYHHDILAEQFEDGHLFYFVYNNDDVAGFAAFNKIDNTTWKLNKIYILPEYQGTGTGKALLEFVIRKVSSENASRLLLNVNRYNKARFFYEKNGFKILKEENIDIGEGYFMNDYVMQLWIDEA